MGRSYVDARLREIDFGDLEGQQWHQLSASAQKAFVEFDRFEAPGGESVRSLRQRVHEFLAELGGGSYVLVTHGGVIRTIRRDVALSDRLVDVGSLTEVGYPR
jgi:broad specificity phosphatase PhoE